MPPPPALASVGKCVDKLLVKGLRCRDLTLPGGARRRGEDVGTMNASKARRLSAAVLATATCALLAATQAVAATTAATGSLPDGGSWVADVPSNWNGALLLYSHGYGTLAPADSPDPATKPALLADGYALA